MHDNSQHALILKRKETTELFGKYLNASGNCFPIMRDLLNGLIEVPDKQQTLEVLCEFVAACRLAKLALEQIFREQNLVEEGKYQVDALQLEALRSSWQLLKSLKQELSVVNLSLSKH